MRDPGRAPHIGGTSTHGAPGKVDRWGATQAHAAPVSDATRHARQPIPRSVSCRARRRWRRGPRWPGGSCTRARRRVSSGSRRGRTCRPACDAQAHPRARSLAQPPRQSARATRAVSAADAAAKLSYPSSPGLSAVIARARFYEVRVERPQICLGLCSQCAGSAQGCTITPPNKVILKPMGSCPVSRKCLQAHGQTVCATTAGGAAPPHCVNEKRPGISRAAGLNAVLKATAIRCTSPSRRRCRASGWRSPTRCRTRSGYGRSCRPSPWSGPDGRSTNADHG